MHRYVSVWNHLLIFWPWTFFWWLRSSERVSLRFLPCARQAPVAVGVGLTRMGTGRWFPSCSVSQRKQVWLSSTGKRISHRMSSFSCQQRGWRHLCKQATLPAGTHPPPGGLRIPRGGWGREAPSTGMKQLLFYTEMSNAQASFSSPWVVAWPMEILCVS